MGISVLRLVGGSIVKYVCQLPCRIRVRADCYGAVLKKSFRGIWIARDPTVKPDFVLYYAHGMGFPWLLYCTRHANVLLRYTRWRLLDGLIAFLP